MQKNVQFGCYICIPQFKKSKYFKYFFETLNTLYTNIKIDYLSFYKIFLIGKSSVCADTGKSLFPSKPKIACHNHKVVFSTKTIKLYFSPKREKQFSCINHKITFLYQKRKIMFFYQKCKITFFFAKTLKYVFLSKLYNHIFSLKR